LQVDAEIELLKDACIELKSRSLVHFYSGTSEVICRVILYDREKLMPGEKSYCQLRLQSPVIVMAEDRYIIRRLSPLQTIGGGEILDPLSRRRRKKEGTEDIGIFRHGSLEQKLSSKILQYGIKGISAPSLYGWINEEPPVIDDALNALIKNGEVINLSDGLLHKTHFNDICKKVLSAVNDFHKKNPLKPGISKEDLRAFFRGIGHRVFDELPLKIKDIAVEKDTVRLKTFNISLTDEKKSLKGKILKAIEASAFQPPMKDELSMSFSINEKEIGELLKIMSAEGMLVRINDSIYISSANYKKMIDAIKDLFKAKQQMTVAEFRDVLNTSRKYALPFLEYLDSRKITLRVGEIRRLLLR